MFALTKAGEKKDEMEEIHLEDLDASAFKEFLGTIYPTRYPITGKLRSTESVSSKRDLYRILPHSGTDAIFQTLPCVNEVKYEFR